MKTLYENNAEYNQYADIVDALTDLKETEEDFVLISVEYKFEGLQEIHCQIDGEVVLFVFK